MLRLNLCTPFGFFGAAINKQYAHYVYALCVCSSPTLATHVSGEVYTLYNIVYTSIPAKFVFTVKIEASSTENSQGTEKIFVHTSFLGAMNCSQHCA